MTMDNGQIFGRGIGFPPQLGPDGRLAFSAGSENVRQSIRIILLTRPGERLMLSGFGAGLNGFLFEPNTVATRRLIRQEIERALEAWEPRISLQSVTVDEDPQDAESAIATLTYTLVASQATEQLSVRVQLGG
jgi:phage baseplate assembly protein W